MSTNTSYRNVRKSRFTQVSNSLLWNKNLSLQAKGLLTIFLSNSDDWELNMKEIIKRSKNGRDAHYNIVNELIEKGYFSRVEILNEKRQFEEIAYLFSDDENDIINALEEIVVKTKNKNKYALIEYKDRNDKQKPQKSTKLNIENAKNVFPLTENQDTDKNPLTENQDTENEYTESQYINNTNGNNTNGNNTNKEEEEIKRAREKNIVYDVLYDFLTQKKIDHTTVYKTIKLLINKDMELFSLSDVKKQYKHMMDKITYGDVDNHNNFARYFVNGLSMRTTQQKANQQHREEQLIEYEKAMKEKEERRSIYYNWLVTDDNE